MLGMIYNSYEGVRLKLSNEKALTTSCENFYNSPKEFVWLKLSECEPDFQNTLVLSNSFKGLKTTKILLPLLTKSQDYQSIKTPLVVVIDDKEFVKKYMEMENTGSEIDSFTKITSLALKYNKSNFKGIINGTSSIKVDGEETKKEYYPLELNKVPAWPLNKIGWSVAMILFLITYVVRKRAKIG